MFSEDDNLYNKLPCMSFNKTKVFTNLLLGTRKRPVLYHACELSSWKHGGYNNIQGMMITFPFSSCT